MHDENVYVGLFVCAIDESNNIIYNNNDYDRNNNSNNSNNDNKKNNNDHNDITIYVFKLLEHLASL